MSQIPRRTPLSMTQAPKVRKTPSATPTSTTIYSASQPVFQQKQQRGQESESPKSTLSLTQKTIAVDTPIVIEDPDFGDNRDNNDLFRVLSSVEEKNGMDITTSAGSPTKSNGKAKETSKRAPKNSSNKKSAVVSPPSEDSVSVDVVSEDNQSSSTSVRSSIETPSVAATVEMDSLLIPEDDELIVKQTLTVEKSAVVSVDSPRPNKTTTTPGKVLRLAKGVRVGPLLKVDQQQGLDNVSTIVNLSTVSEQSLENQLDSAAATASEETPSSQEEGGSAGSGQSSEESSGGTGSRRISARRTYATNLREMSFRNAFKRGGVPTAEENSNEEESSTAAAVNDSVNATVGSELGFNMDDLPETPAVGNKRRRDSSDGEEDSLAPEPKKSLFQQYCVVM